jgi:hypothetical protein
MKRMLEWIFASIAAILCIGGAALLWINQAGNNPPGVSLWPLPALVLIEIITLGLAGFLGSVVEPCQSSARWGYLAWIACGGLLGLSILGAAGFSIIFLLFVPGLAFFFAALLADDRRGRKLLPDLGALGASAVINFGLFALISMLTVG